VAFFLWQARAKHPVLPLRVLADRDRAAALSTILISSAGMFGVFLFLTYYLQSTLGYSPVKNGVAFLPMVGALMVMAQLSTNWLVPKIGPKIVVPLGMLVAAGGMVWLTRLGLGSSYASHVLPPLLLLGAGLGMSMPAAMSYATLGVQANDQGVASAALNTTQQVGGSISTALLNTLAATAATHYAEDHLSDPLVKANAALHSYEVAYWWSAGFFAVGVIITALLFRAKRRQTAPAEQVEAPAEAAPAAPSVTAPTMDTAAPVIRGQVRNGTGVPVPRTAITLLDGSGRQLARATSGEDGTYALATAERGSLVLIGSAPGHQPQVVTLSVNGAPVSHDLVILPSPGGLAGTVRGGDGEPLPGALVVATDQHGDVTASVTAGTDGGYQLAELLPGDYTLSVSAPGHRPVAVPAGVSAETARLDIELTTAATLRGTVHTPDGRALDDARVTLIDAAGNVVGTRTTSVDGGYAFTDLASEQYTVIASGYPTVATQVTVNGSQDGVDLRLSHKEA
jgi:MFS family permease